MWNILLLLSVSSFFVTVKSQFFTITENPGETRTGEVCQNNTAIETTDAASIVECTMICVRSDKTAVFDEEKKTCRCFEKCTPSGGSPNVIPPLPLPINSSQLLYKGDSLGYNSFYDDALVLFTFESDLKNKGRLDDLIDINPGNPSPIIKNGSMVTVERSTYGNGPYLSGIQNIPCFGSLHKDFIQTCSKTGISLSFWAKKPINSSSEEEIYVDVHSSNNGFKVRRYPNNNLVFQLLTDTFTYQCIYPMSYDDSIKWNHFGLSFRIKPSPKLTCYLNEVPKDGDRGSRSVNYGTAILFGWRYTSNIKQMMAYDDFALWDRHVDENEMKRIFEHGRTQT